MIGKWLQKIIKYNDKSNARLFSRIPAWLYIFILSIIIFWAHPIVIASDLKVYSSSALNIFLGKGYVDIDGSPILFRPPLFPFLLSVSYWLFGVSHRSTFWVIKTFCILNPIIVYAIGKRFFGKRVGISAALLVLTSYTINFWSFRHLDAVWPFFILLSTYSLYTGFEKNNSWFFVLGGISLAFAYLVKEVAILFFPLPFLMFILISDYRKKFYFTKILLCFAVTCIVIIPWFVYLIKHNQVPGVNLIIGGAGSSVLKSITNPSGLNDTQNVLKVIAGNLKAFFLGVWHYYHGAINSVDKWFTIAPIFIMAWCFSFYCAFRGNKPLRILVLHFLLFMPAIYIQGAHDMRVGQTLIIFLLSYLAVAVFIDGSLKIVSQKIEIVGKYMPKIFWVTITGLIMVQIFIDFRNDHGYKKFLEDYLYYRMGANDIKEVKAYSYSTIAGDDDVLDIINKFSTPPNRLYMAITNRSLAKESYFSLKGENAIYYFKSQVRKRTKDYRVPEPDEQPIYLTVLRRPGSHPHYLEAVYKSQIIEAIKKENITHVLVENYNTGTVGNKGLDRYFAAWRAFKKIPIPSDEFSIYKVVSNTLTAPTLPPILDMGALNAFSSICSERNKKNLLFLKRSFSILYPSNPCQQLKNKATDSVHISDEQSYKASLLSKAGMNRLYNGDLEQAIESFKQAICVKPDFLDAYKNLFFAGAFLGHLKAIALDSKNPIHYYHYAVFLDAFDFFEAALMNVQKAISLDKNYAAAYVVLGSIYDKQNKHHKAIDALQRAISIYQKHIGPRKEWRLYTNYLQIGDSFMQLGNLSKAKLSYEQAIRTNCDPKFKPGAYYKLGVVYQNLNNHPSAIENFKKAIHLNPDFAAAYYNLSKNHLLLGNKKDAIKQFKKLREVDKTFAHKLNEEFGFPFE